MRSHGVPDFPDPDASGVFQNIDYSSPHYASASKACVHWLPNGGQTTQADIAEMLTAGLKSSACMRAHGVTGYPDPIIEYPGPAVAWKAGNYDPNSLQYKRTDRLCEPLMNGS